MLLTKLHRPPLTTEHVFRKNLISNLNDNCYKPLSLVCAPAGYGKSMLVSSWLETSHYPYAWISLSSDDNDVHIFLSYLHLAIKTIFPESLKNTSELIDSADLPPLDVLADEIINELDIIKEDFVLVLDDYHLIKDDGIHYILDRLLEFPPEHIHIVITTRRDPPLQLKRLRVHQRMNEIRMNELGFIQDDVVRFFKKSKGITLKDSTARSFQKKTEGWITVLQLVSLSISESQDTETILANYKGSTFMLTEFLIEEVLDRQPADLRELLIRTSILNQFCASLLDEIQQAFVDGKESTLSGEEFIDWLSKSNLFLIPLDNEKKWFRFHHLFQELLIKQVTKYESEEQQIKMHQCAAIWHVKEGMVDEAIEHYKLAGDVVAAAKLIEDNAHDIFLHGIYLIKTLLNKIPKEIKESRPLVLLIEAWYVFGQFQLEKIPPILEKVQSIVNEDNDSPRVQAEISFFQGNFMYWMGETEASIQILSNALNIAVGLPTHVKSNIELIHNLALQKAGNYETAVNELEHKIRATEKSEGFYLSYLYGSLTFIHLLSGKLLAAADVAYKMQIQSSDIKSNYLLGWSYYLHASADFSMFKLKESLALFTITIEREHRYSLDLRVVLDAMVSSALIHYFLKDQKYAYDILKELTVYTTELNDPQSILVAQSAKARIDLLTGDIKSAFQWAETFNMPPMFPGIFFWIEVPWITKAKILVSKGTVDSLENAATLLQELLELVVSSNLDYHKVDILMLLAITYDKLDRGDEARQFIKEAVLLADKQSCVRPFIEAEVTVVPLLKKLSEQGTATEFISNLVSIRDDMDEKTIPIDTREAGQSPNDEYVALTEREQETLQLLAEGLRNKEIGNKLFVSESTVKRHVYNMSHKLGTKGRVELINKSRTLGYIK